MVVDPTRASSKSRPRDQAASEHQTSRLFHALADPTRRDILRRAQHNELSVSALARNYPISIAAVQKHVAVLEEAHLVTRRKQGREQIVSADLDTLKRAHQALDALEVAWRDRIERIDHLLAEPETETQPAKEQHK